MNKRASIVILEAALAFLGVAATITGIVKDEKSFFTIAAVCMSFFGISFYLFIRSLKQPGRE